MTSFLCLDRDLNLPPVAHSWTIPIYHTAAQNKNFQHDNNVTTSKPRHKLHLLLKQGDVTFGIACYRQIQGPVASRDSSLTRADLRCHISNQLMQQSRDVAPHVTCPKYREFLQSLTCVRLSSRGWRLLSVQKLLPTSDSCQDQLLYEIPLAFVMWCFMIRAAISWVSNLIVKIF